MERLIPLKMSQNRFPELWKNSMVESKKKICPPDLPHQRKTDTQISGGGKNSKSRITPDVG